MTKSRIVSLCELASLLISWLGCTSGLGPDRLLTSITVTPATVTAPTSSRKVQFKATGEYTALPSPDRVPNATWCVSDSNGCIITTNVTIDVNGLAQCDPAFSGTETVMASASNGAPAPVMPGGTGVLISGTAQVTCP